MADRLLTANSKKQIVLVTGATGALGPALVSRLQREGYAVRTLARRPPPLGLFGPSVQTVLGDVAHEARVAEAVQDVSLVFHLAARLHEPSVAPDMKGDCERVNVVGTQTVARAAANAGVSRLVYFSTVSVYGPSDGQVADEATTPRPSSVYGETKLRGERMALAVRRLGTGQPLACVLRLAAVYGPHMKGNYLRLARALASRWFVPIGKGLSRRTLVYEGDAADAALMAATHPDALGKIYNVTDGQVHRLEEILAAMCAALGRRTPSWRLPLGAARSAAAMGDRLLGLLGQGAQARPLLEKYLEEVAVSGAKIESELGFKARFDLETGWRSALAELRATR